MLEKIEKIYRYGKLFEFRLRNNKIYGALDSELKGHFTYDIDAPEFFRTVYYKAYILDSNIDNLMYFTADIHIPYNSSLKKCLHIAMNILASKIAKIADEHKDTIMSLPAILARSIKYADMFYFHGYRYDLLLGSQSTYKPKELEKAIVGTVFTKEWKELSEELKRRTFRAIMLASMNADTLCSLLSPKY